ncbi:hypothetical protein D9758_002025 [Tetrapyrgos nigripes]|uniref:Calcium-dependent phosphotriesterase n=1 Tax=Tetrapyrgos nigripes TaxID=182062 RepID=A0A8H5LV65_9AGAR|nr:hypothetical protein D9758_002025 [Tetrapyrgos nigripes]
MASTLITILVLLVAIAAGLYQFYGVPLLTVIGYWRVVQPIGNTDCTTVPELKACEKIVVHDPTGVLYLACSTPENRLKWIPAAGILNENPHEDYIATYDPSTSKVTRLQIENFNSGRGLSVHGMDVVPSDTNPSELYVYAVNHRLPLDGKDPKVVGADSVIEIFKTRVGSSSLAHVNTVEDSTVLTTPNDVTGFSDGKSFFFTNDHGPHKTGTLKGLRNMFTSIASVGYCHVEHGCSIVVPKMHAANGITKAPNGTIYVGSFFGAGISVFERQEDNSLVLTDFISSNDIPLDNLSIDTEGAVWGAGIVKANILSQYMKDPSVLSPTRAVKFTVNTGPGSFYGEKYRVETAFEDDGKIATGTTSVAHDALRKRLFIHGIMAPWLTICKT